VIACGILGAYKNVLSHMRPRVEEKGRMGMLRKLPHTSVGWCSVHRANALLIRSDALPLVKPGIATMTPCALRQFGAPVANATPHLRAWLQEPFSS
jgi:hypothetical protein